MNQLGHALAVSDFRSLTLPKTIRAVLGLIATTTGDQGSGPMTTEGCQRLKSAPAPSSERRAVFMVIYSRGASGLRY